MSAPTPGPMHRTSAQVSHERALAETSDVLLNLDHTIARAKKARTIVARDDDERNVELALGDLITELDRVRKRLMRDTYYAGDALRLL